MHEYAALDARLLRQRIVPQAAPGLRKSLATLKALWRDRDGLDAPLAAGLIGIDDIDGLFGCRYRKLVLELEQVFLCHYMST